MHDDIAEVGPLHLDERVLSEAVEPPPAQDAKVLSLPVPSRAACPLVDVGLADPGRDEGRQVLGRVVPLLLDAGRVDDEDDVGDRDGRLGDVGREDDAPLARAGSLEDSLLLLDGHRRVQDVERDIRRVEVEAERVTPGEDAVHLLD